jgi:hypothetical protein
MANGHAVETTMKTFVRSWILRVLTLMVVASVALAQERTAFRQEELDQMLAPVALYPDALLSQILMASTYPLEVVQAARWSRANPGLRGQDAVRAVERMDWDPSVKSLTAFPQILHMMDEKLAWTERLGEAFLVQQAEVMDTVQQLRRRADAAGHLDPGDRMRVTREGDIIRIHPPAPDVVYVPYYDPRVVYGPWWWHDYPPVYWAPPAYYVVPSYPTVFFWGSGIGIAANFFFGYPDWHRRHVTVVHRHVTVVNRERTIVSPAPRERVVWRHNPQHRRGVPFRNPDARARFEQERATAGERRRGRERHDAEPAYRRGSDAPRADTAQRQSVERTNAVPQQRQPAARRLAPDNGGDRAPRAPFARNEESGRAAVPPEPRRMPPDTRNARTEYRVARPERSEPRPAASAVNQAPRTEDSARRGGRARDQGERESRGRSGGRGDRS